MKVSVLLLTYNQEQYIAQAIESALMQKTNFEFEIVISEDCSTDRTRAIVEDYEARHPDRIRVRYSPHNLGGVENFVLTYHACRGDYVALLEGDDYWTSPEKLQKQADFLDHHVECSMCGHAMVVTRGDDQAPLEYTWSKRVSTLEDLILNNFICTASAMLRKEVFNGYPRWVYDAPFSDYPIWMQAAQHGHVGYINEFLGVYRIHHAGAWSGKGTLAQVNDLIEFYERMRREVDPSYDHVFERVLARWYGQLACERAGLPADAVVLVASGGDPELLKPLPGGRQFRHFPGQPDGGGVPLPRRREELVESLEAARAQGAQFLLVPQTVLAELGEHTAVHRLLPRESPYGLRRELDRRYRRIWDSPDALLYDLRPMTEDWQPRRGKRPSVSTRLLPPPIRRLREHLREIRRVAGETQQEVVDSHAALSRQLAQLDASVRSQADALSRIEARLEDLAQVPDRDRSTGGNEPS